MEQLIVTIGRQSGSGGREIGERLAKRLGIALYGKAELNEIAKNTEDYDEVRSFYEEEPVNSLLFAIAMNYEEQTDCVPFSRIRDLCKKEPCVLIGRCGTEIFKNDENAVRIFIHADKKIRLARVMEREGLSERKAREFLEETDKKRASFHRYYAHREWGLAEDYELCLDSGVLGIEGTVDVIMDYLRFRGKRP